MILAIASAAMACLTITQTVLIAYRYQTGWWLMLAGQLVPWTAYDIITRQFGFLILTPVMSWIAYKGLRNHAYLTKQERTDNARASTSQKEPRSRKRANRGNRTR
jgi:hypothetical protein